MKTAAKYILTLVLTIALLTGALTLACSIDTGAIREQVEESSEYFNENPLFESLWADNVAYQTDHYGDCVLVSMAYGMDTDHPLQSALYAKYFQEKTENVHIGLAKALEAGGQPEKEYLRYWHGSLIFLRPLLTFLNIEQIYRLNAVLIGLLFLTVTGLLLYRKRHALCIAFVVSMMLNTFFVTPFSVEHSIIMLCMLIACILTILFYPKLQKEGNLIWFCLILGIVTAFFDFLTTETLTFTIPFLIVSCMAFEDGILTEFKSGFRLLLKSGIGWLAGYALTWTSKWLLASAVLHLNAFHYVTGNIEERIYGNVGTNAFTRIFGSLFRNLSMIFPFHFLSHGALWCIVTVLVILAVIYLFHRKGNGWFVKLLALVAAIPYVRYLALSNHACLHFFFTSRAQVASFMALILAAYYLTGYQRKINRK